MEAGMPCVSAYGVCSVYCSNGIDEDEEAIGDGQEERLNLS